MKKLVACTIVLILTVCMGSAALAGQMPIAWMVEGSLLTISGFTSVPTDLASYFSKSERDAITAILIDDGVTGIDDYAFAGFPNVISLTIADSVVNIGKDVLAPSAANCHVNTDSETITARLMENNPNTHFSFEGMTNAYVREDVPEQAPISAEDVVIIDPSEPQAAPETMEKFSAVLTNLKAWGMELEYNGFDLHGDGQDQIEYEYAVTDGSDSYRLLFNCDSEGQMSQIMLTAETLNPGAAWDVICRGIPALEALELPESVREIGQSIEIRNGGFNKWDEADGWQINVGGVMDVRSAWSLRTM